MWKAIADFLRGAIDTERIRAIASVQMELLIKLAGRYFRCL